MFLGGSYGGYNLLVGIGNVIYFYIIVIFWRMFITPCFIRNNTFAIRVELSKLGYENSTNNVVGDSIATTPVTSHYTTISQKMYDDPNPNSTWSNNRIDCGRNEEMFLALAALRKDTDKNQWFICQEEYISTHTMDFVKVGTWQLNTQYDKLPYSLKKLWRKAKVEEIIEHFRK